MNEEEFGTPVEGGANNHREDHGHDTRVDELSENDAIHREDLKFSDWADEENLIAPKAQEGMTQRWVRVSLDGADDPKNMHKKLRQGWKARPVDTMPSSFKSLGTKKSWDEGILRVDDLVLMEMSTLRAEDRKRYYAKKTASLMTAVESELHGSQVEGNPISQNNQSKVSTSKRRVAPADD